MKITDQFLLDAYSGRGGFETGSYLIAHPRETDEKYKRRQELCIYPNYVKKVVNLYLSYLFSPPIHRESLNDTYLQFAALADRQRDLSTVMRSHWLKAMTLGTVALIVDRPRGVATTAAAERALVPYLVRRLPVQIQSITLNEDGQVAEAVFREKEQFRWYTADGWRITKDAEGKEITDSGEYALGRPPVVLLHSTEPADGDWRATSWHYDLARLNFDLFNQVSELRELLRSQTFSVLAIPVSDTADADAMTEVEVGPENGLMYDPKGGGAPQFIAPPSTAIDCYMQTIKDLRSQIYEAASMEFTGGVQQSGVALEYHFQLANKTLADMAQMCESAERQIAELVCGWMGQAWDGQIAYSRDFSIPSLLNDLKVAMDSLDLRIAPAFDRALKKRISRQILDRKASDETLAEIDREIDADGDPYGDRVTREAAI